jgi:hypothetical protein
MVFDKKGLNPKNGNLSPRTNVVYGITEDGQKPCMLVREGVSTVCYLTTPSVEVITEKLPTLPKLSKYGTTAIGSIKLDNGTVAINVGVCLSNTGIWTVVPRQGLDDIPLDETNLYLGNGEPNPSWLNGKPYGKQIIKEIVLTCYDGDYDRLWGYKMEPLSIDRHNFNPYVFSGQLTLRQVRDELVRVYKKHPIQIGQSTLASYLAYMPVSILKTILDNKLKYQDIEAAVKAMIPAFIPYDKNKAFENRILDITHAYCEIQQTKNFLGDVLVDGNIVAELAKTINARTILIARKRKYLDMDWGVTGWLGI